MSEKLTDRLRAHVAASAGVKLHQRNGVSFLTDETVLLLNEAAAELERLTAPPEFCDVCGDQFSDLAGHKALGVQTHPWLLAGKEKNQHLAGLNAEGEKK